MNGLNLFEQQALQQWQSRAPAPRQQTAPGQRPAQTPLASQSPPSGLEVLRYIEGANLEQCGKVAVHLSARLFRLEKQHSGMQAANLNEAAHFAADAATDIEGALRADDEAPCSCGLCDSCAAARSDEHHDRARDGAAA